MTDHLLWHLARATGLVTLVLLTASVVLGIAATSRSTPGRWPRFATQHLHRNVALLAVSLLTIHVGTSIADGYLQLRWYDALVPFGTDYRPVALGLGTLALDLVVALVVTSGLRRHLGYPAWRGVHWAAYAAWPLAVAHGIAAGSDTAATPVRWLTVGCVGAVAVALAARHVPSRTPA